ncbi:MAG: polyhydroxyalkanoate depolymerase [Rhodobacterales bacterium]|nr:polyhydroxyalkanoate depolymerase [Rhodobacterales bacterium]
MLYHMYEMKHAAMAPVRVATEALEDVCRNPYNPFAYTAAARFIAAGCEVVERVTRRYGKPEWMIDWIEVGDRLIGVREEAVLCHRFCDLVHFRRDDLDVLAEPLPKVLLVAPMSGHYATLIRGTVRQMLHDHDVYVTDWINAQDVPMTAGTFGLDDYIDYVMEFLRMLGPDVHVMAICQPSVPVLAAVSLMSADDHDCKPRSMTLMGGPIDTRVGTTKVNELAEGKSIGWFERTVIQRVPAPHAGFLRRVYPGFIQLTGFMTMNLDRHMNAHLELFNHLIEGDGDSAEAHRDFYDEYNAVMDLPAEFYLETLRAVFMHHDLPMLRMAWRGRKVDPRAIDRTALLTIEGEKDDITGAGQTEAAHALCTGLPPERKRHYVQESVGHYGIFNGRRWREEVYPIVREFIRNNA